MNKYCMVETPFDNETELNKVINELLDKHLVASTHVIESKSSWNYKNKRESSKEYILEMKTIKDNLKEIYDVIKRIHSYEVFEFAIYDITSISNEYLSWLEEETKKNKTITI